jgi:hypothetical protein
MPSTASERPIWPAPALAEAQEALRQAEKARADLKSGWGIYHHTDAGRAVADLAEAKKAVHWTGREKDAAERWQTYVAPEAARLESEIERHRAVIEELTARRESQAAASRLGGERRWNLQRDAHRLAVGLDSHRSKFDGIPGAPRRSSGQTRKAAVPSPTPQHEPVNRPRLGM